MLTVLFGLALFGNGANARAQENTKPMVAASSLPTASITYAMEDAFPGLSFDQPLAIVSAPGDKDRLFIVEKNGRIQVITGLISKAPAAKVFLDLTHPRDGNLFSEGECGILGLAFPPDYATSHRCFVYYSLKVKIQKKLKLCERLSLFPITPDVPDLADVAAEQSLWTQQDAASNHNGGDLHFGPDGYLYISVGDGGIGDDKLDQARFINQGFHAAILRIDVDKKPGSLPPNPHPGIALTASGDAPYSVPSDNPFVGANSYHGQPVDPQSVRTEIWASGLRNPWRFSFDEATGNLFVGDVGQNLYEEVDLITRGGDYGWSYREAEHPFTNGPGKNLEPMGFNPVEPIFEYDRTVGISVTGGRVHHSSSFPELNNAYIFADFGTGAVMALRLKDKIWSAERIATEPAIAAIGKDPRDDSLLFASLGQGKIKRLSRTVPTSR